MKGHAPSQSLMLVREEEGETQQKRQMEERHDAKVQKIRGITCSSWHHLGFRGACLGTRGFHILVLPPPSTHITKPISISVAQATKESIPVSLATVQYDLSS